MDITDAFIDSLTAEAHTSGTGIVCKDRRHFIHSYKNCFVASEAVDWILANVRKAGSRQDGVVIAQTMQKKGYIVHVSEPGKLIQDDFNFFRFTSTAPRRQMYEKITDATPSEKRVELHGPNLGLLHLKDDPDNLRELGKNMRENIKTYPKVLDGWKHSAVFTGADMVNWVMDQQPTGDVLPRAHAAEVAAHLHDLSLFTSAHKEKRFEDDRDSYYSFCDQYKFETECLKRRTKQVLVGRAKRCDGLRPKYPIILVPGLASTALEVWDSPREDWLRTRVWVDPFKIGSLSVAHEMKQDVKSIAGKMASRLGIAESPLSISNKDSTERIDAEIRQDINLEWMKHMVLAEDGFSDPPGIRVRPCTGMHACDFLGEGPFDKKPSYVLAHLMSSLANFGYEPRNLIAEPFDWRIPPEKLEERDHYYSRMKCHVEFLHKMNKEKVVIVAHSMGNRCVQYFLAWVENEEKGWCDEHIHAFLAMGAPFLGAPKAVRTVVSGDQLSLEIFLTLKEGLAMARTNAALPWLFPLREKDYPNSVAYLRDGPEKWSSNTTQDIVTSASPKSWGFWQNFFVKNPFFLNEQDDNTGKDNAVNNEDKPPVLRAPPVNLWCLYGVNVPTEISYYLSASKSKKYHFKPVVDAEEFSEKITTCNPGGLLIKNGIGYETPDTLQPTVNRSTCGDGTVPYASLQYARNWEKELNANGKELHMIEVEGAEHREMLNSDVVFGIVMDFLSGNRDKN